MINLNQIGTFNTAIEGVAEIPAYDRSSQRLFVVNAKLLIRGGSVHLFFDEFAIIWEKEIANKWTCCLITTAS